MPDITLSLTPDEFAILEAKVAAENAAIDASNKSIEAAKAAKAIDGRNRPEADLSPQAQWTVASLLQRRVSDGIQQEVQQRRHQQAQELAQKLAADPEKLERAKALFKDK